MVRRTNGQANGRVHGLIEKHRPGWTLDQAFYTDPEIFELDMKNVFGKYWLYAGHVSQIPNPGDYFLRNVQNESLIIMRGDDHQVRALYNVCRHRGSQICWEETGHMGNLVCPYHAWVYKRDGSLKHARLFPEDFDKSRFGLHRAPVEVLEGFIFISLSDDPVDFEPAGSLLGAYLEPHDIANAKVCHTEYLDIKANWKVLDENFRECYHCGPTHPELCSALAWSAGVGSDRLREEEARLIEMAKPRWKEMGLPFGDWPREGTDEWYYASRVPLTADHDSLTLDGKLVAPPMGRFEGPEGVGYVSTAVLPTFSVEFSVDHGFMMCFTPVTPTVTRLQQQWLVRGDAVEGVDYDLAEVTKLWKITGPQDWDICERQQVGISSSRYRPAAYADEESWTVSFINWYLGQVGGQTQPLEWEPAAIRSG